MTGFFSGRKTFLLEWFDIKQCVNIIKTINIMVCLFNTVKQKLRKILFRSVNINIAANNQIMQNFFATFIFLIKTFMDLFFLRVSQQVTISSACSITWGLRCLLVCLCTCRFFRRINELGFSKNVCLWEISNATKYLAWIFFFSIRKAKPTPTAKQPKQD